jgi:hypothetical protein
MLTVSQPHERIELDADPLRLSQALSRRGPGLGRRSGYRSVPG